MLHRRPTEGNGDCVQMADAFDSFAAVAVRIGTK